MTTPIDMPVTFLGMAGNLGTFADGKIFMGLFGGDIESSSHPAMRRPCSP
jgi:hypothetical protein